MSQPLKTKSSTQSPSDRKLSELARHVVIPSGIVTTGWPAVRDQCARVFRIGFDEWQHGIGKISLAKRADGTYAASVGGVVLSIPRQTGKTYLIAWMVFALCTLNKNLTVVWTAHRTRTSDETFQKMRTMALHPRVKPHILGNPRQANGQQQILFTNGSRILFGAREQGFGRGFDKVDVLVLDEAQILTEAAMSDMVPATNAAPNGLVFLMGTPPRPKDPGEVFTNRRGDALAGDKDTVFVEFSADEGARIIDWAQLAKANPSFPHRTSKTAILRMQKLLGSDEGFKREAYGIWDTDSAKKALSFKAWESRTVDASVKPKGRICYGVKFSADGSTVALAVGVREASESVHVEGVKVANMGEGIGWLVEWLAARAEQASQIVIDGKSGAGALVEALAKAGVRPKSLVALPTLDQVISAHAMFKLAVAEGGLTHIGQAALDAEVESALQREIGRAGGFGWAAPNDGSVTLLDAVTLAFWGAKTTTRLAVEDLGGSSARRAANTGGRGGR